MYTYGGRNIQFCYKYVYAFVYLSLLELEAESAASQPVLPVPLQVQTDDFAAIEAGRWPAFWMGVGGGWVVVLVRKWIFFRHHDASTDAPKVLDRWEGGVQGMFPWGKFAIESLRRALLLHSRGLYFEEI